MKSREMVEFEKYVLERIHARAQTNLPGELLRSTRVEVEQIGDFIADNLYRATLHLYTPGRMKIVRAEVEVPLGWVQHLKDTWAPEWVRRRWPVKKHVIVTLTEYRAVCPHLPMDPARDHVEWVFANIEPPKGDAHVADN